MKIALVADWFLPRVGGLELHLRDLAQRLQRQGHEVHVLTSTPGPDHTGGLPVHRLPVARAPRYGFACTPDVLWQIHAVLQRERFDLVHAHGSLLGPTAFGGAYVAQRLGLPTVLTFHSMIGAYLPLFHVVAAILGFSRWPVALSCVSEAVAEGLGGLLAGRPLHLLPNAVDPAAWRGARPPRDEGTVTVTSVMRLYQRKRPQVLVKAIPGILASLPPGRRARFRIVGDGFERPRLERLVHRLGLSASVEFLGQRTRDEVRSVLAGTDVFALPSRLESFGIAALEASTAGVPVVGFEQGGVKSFIRDGVNGFLVRSDREFAERIALLLRDGARREEMARANREAAPVFTWDSVLEKHLALYAQAIRARTGERGLDVGAPLAVAPDAP